jgi:hypothetical protein
MQQPWETLSPAAHTAWTRLTPPGLSGEQVYTLVQGRDAIRAACADRRRARATRDPLLDAARWLHPTHEEPTP